jgi:uncharacterized protein YukE
MGRVEVMKTYSITDPSGKVHTIDGPEGATRDQVIAKIQERLSVKQAEPDLYTQQAQKQSIGENLLAGIGGGMTGLYLGAKQLLGQAKPEEIEEHKKAMEGLRSTTAGTVGDIGGQILGAAPAMLIPGVNTAVGSTLLGGAMGALQPRSEDDSLAANVGFGAAGGAVGKYIGDAVGNLGSKVMARINQPNAAHINLTGELSKQGIDFSKLSKEVQDSLLDDANRALRAGGTLHGEELARMADFRATGIQPTLGQITRDPKQYTFEMNTRGISGAGDDLTNRFNEQNVQLINAVNRARGTMGGPEQEKYNAGERMLDLLRTQDEASRTNVGNLYETARNTAGIHTPLNNHNFTNALNDELDQRMVGDAIPTDIRNTLNRIATGDMPFTVQKAEQIRQAINDQMPKIPGRERTALQAVNHHLQTEIDSLGDTLGGQSGEAFKAARAAASQRFGELDRSPALKAATQDFEPNDFVDKFILKAKPTHLSALVSDLRRNPELLSEAKGQVIDFLKSKALSGQTDEYGKFSQAGLKNGINAIGEERLKRLFSPTEVEEIKRIQRVAAAIMVRPAGGSVNESHTSQAIANLLTRLANVPYLKELAINPIMNLKMQGRVNQALNPGVQVTPAVAKGTNSRVPGLVGGSLGANINNY